MGDQIKTMMGLILEGELESAAKLSISECFRSSRRSSG